RKALADTQLRRNLGKATTTIRAKRAAVVAELPDWEELREAGRAIKAHTMRHLDHYLTELESQVTARGGTVHWARDAIEANRIGTDLGRVTGAAQVVKVKSIVTDEIGLNDALAGAGIHACETDLAELIVQLGRDRPSHILVPAIHRNRAEIRDIFLREMGDVDPGLSDTPAALTEAARLHLRRAFLSARVGISGANFAVAETGTLCVLESEGNGRMCLTLPETLITVMGIEKVVPSRRDLDVFMQLLPRSSTGERMNPYTSMWTGVTPGDGPQAFHLVLLDNGRTAALADETGRQALHCIRCSACLNVGPVYERTGGHAYGSVSPGPIRAGLCPARARVGGEGTGLRWGLPRPDRGGAVTAADRGGGQRVPAVRVVAVRRLLRRLPGEDRHPLAPGPPARAARRGGRPGAPAARPGGDHHGRRVLGDGQPGAVGRRAEREPARPRARRGGPHPPAPMAAVGLDRGTRPAGATRADLPRVVARRTRGPAAAGARPRRSLARLRHDPASTASRCRGPGARRRSP